MLAFDKGMVCCKSLRLTCLFVIQELTKMLPASYTSAMAWEHGYVNHAEMCLPSQWTAFLQLCLTLYCLTVAFNQSATLPRSQTNMHAFEENLLSHFLQVNRQYV